MEAHRVRAGSVADVARRRPHFKSVLVRAGTRRWCRGRTDNPELGSSARESTTRSGSCSTRLQGRHGDKPMQGGHPRGLGDRHLVLLAVELVAAVGEAVRPREKHCAMEAGRKARTARRTGTRRARRPETRGPRHRPRPLSRPGRRRPAQTAGRTAAKWPPRVVPDVVIGSEVSASLRVTLTASPRRGVAEGPGRQVSFGPVPAPSASLMVPLGRTFCREERCG